MSGMKVLVFLVVTAPSRHTVIITYDLISMFTSHGSNQSFVSYASSAYYTNYTKCVGDCILWRPNRGQFFFGLEYV